MTAVESSKGSDDEGSKSVQSIVSEVVRVENNERSDDSEGSDNMYTALSVTLILEHVFSHYLEC